MYASQGLCFLFIFTDAQRQSSFFRCFNRFSCQYCNCKWGNIIIFIATKFNIIFKDFPFPFKYEVHYLYVVCFVMFFHKQEMHFSLWRLFFIPIFLEIIFVVRTNIYLNSLRVLFERFVELKWIVYIWKCVLSGSYKSYRCTFTIAHVKELLASLFSYEIIMSFRWLTEFVTSRKFFYKLCKRLWI